MYQVQNPIQQAMTGMSQASGTYGSMMKDIPANRKPEPTAGGAIMSGAGGAVAGAQLGTMIGGAGTATAAGSATAAGATAAGSAAGGAASGSMAGPYGAMIGAAIGFGAYLLS